MFCPKCGKPIPDDSSFCMFCGKSIPQIRPAPSPELRPEPFDAPIPAEAPPDPFGDDLPDDFDDEPEEFYPEPLVEPETFSPELALDELDLPEIFDDAPRRCTLCGRELPETNTTGLCVTCTSNRSFVPSAEPDRFELDLDLDADYPEEFRDTKGPGPEKKRKNRAPAQHKRKVPLLPVLIAALAMAALACFAFYFLKTDAPGGTDQPGASVTTPNAREREAISYAQSMVKAKAANPSSVHFDAQSLTAAEKDGVWTVKQSFERLAPDGQMAQSSYTAMLTLDESAPEGYKALMLQVDDATLYDYR